MKKQKQIAVFNWIWNAYLRTALIPVIVAELLFIITYFATISWSQVNTIKFLRSEEIEEMQLLLEDRTESIEQQLHTVSYATELLTKQFERALLERNTDLTQEDLERLALSGEGVYYTTKNKASDGAAVFYSGIYPVLDSQKNKVANLLSVQEGMKDIVNTIPLASQVYINTYDSLNIIYPYFDVISQFDPKMDIPSFNFYYEADEQHNPDRSVEWTEAYLDPAGLGWMASSIMPLYDGDFLEGVVGIDITISTITDEVLNMDIPWGGYGLLVGADGTILALPQVGEEEWGLDELTEHTYVEAIHEDTFRPEEFNIYKREDLSEIVDKLSDSDIGYDEIMLNGEKKLFAWNTIEETGWILIVVIPEKNVFLRINNMKTLMLRIGGIFTVSGILFYLLFFYVLSRKAKTMSLNISRPLIVMNDMVKDIGNGNYYHDVPDIKVTELYDTAKFLSKMGSELGDSHSKLIDIQKELELREAFLSAIVESIDDIIIIADEDGNIKDEWKAYSHIHEKTIKEIKINSIEHFIGADEYQRIINQIKTDGVKKKVEFKLGKYPEISWYQAMVSQIEWNSPLFVISARDITENKNLEESLVSAKDEAERASLAKSQFLSSMSHELRTPLNAILGFSQILLTDPNEPLTFEQQDSVNEILNAGRHLLNLINEVLDLARIESGKMVISMETLRVTDVLKEVTSLMMPLAEQYRVKFITELDFSENLTVVADLTRIKQILVNLVTNAFKYNKKNGNVNLYIEEEQDVIRFNIKDTGVGIKPEDMELLFQPFQRLDFKNSTTIEGTGIGLSVAKKLTEMMKGRIGVRSTWGEGSLFYIELEKGEEFKPQGIGFEHENLIIESSEEILSIVYIEDNPANMSLMKKYVDKIPNTILFTAENGEKGIRMVLQKKPDLVLLDMNLPDMDGETVFIRLKQMESLENIPVVALSANAMNEDIKRTLKLGFSDYLVKPLDLIIFSKKLNEIRENKKRGNSSGK